MCRNDMRWNDRAQTKRASESVSSELNCVGVICPQNDTYRPMTPGSAARKRTPDTHVGNSGRRVSVGVRTRGVAVSLREVGSCCSRKENRGWVGWR